MNLAQTDIMESIGGKLSDIVDKYGKDNNYTVILDMSAQGSPVIFNNPQLDITEEIVRLYDQAHPLKSGATGATPAPTSAPAARPATPPATTTPGRGAAPAGTPGRGTTPPAGPGR